LSFKNLTEVDRKVYWSYNLTFMERRLGNEAGATNEVFGNGLSTVLKTLQSSNLIGRLR
jgi:hypothetical protein